MEVQETETEAEVEKSKEQEKKSYLVGWIKFILAKEKSKWQKKAEEDKEEAKKLAKMNAEEKAKFELDKKQSILEQREKEITKRERLQKLNQF